MPSFQLITPPQGNPITLRLSRNLVRTLKRGHPWVFADALRDLPSARPGSHAQLLDNKKGREIAWGFYDPHSPLAFRACSVEPDQPVDDQWAEGRLARALALRRQLFDDQTTGFRLFNGEGDGLPGLVCDLYGQTAVLQLDGAGPIQFWQPRAIAGWLADRLDLEAVYWRSQSRSETGDQLLVGHLPPQPAHFLENGVRFTADLRHGQKTGFFFDQRDNRQLIRPLAEGRSVLNLFGYTGGFSVYAGLGGARQVTTVDTAEPALAAADAHWQLNGLPPEQHKSVATDAFQFLAEAARHKKRWELVIVDPPSFAPAKEAVPRAVSAYQKLIAAAAEVTGPEGLLAAASCSSHIDLSTFLSICEEGISRAWRRATLLRVTTQPADHPTPLPFSEFRYLKFVLMRVE